jgi:hypothetical protein
VLYVLLEYLGIGPRVVFFVDASSAGGLHILTEEVPGATFPVCSDTGRADTGLFAVPYQNSPTLFLEAVLLEQMLGLKDCHEFNFCLHGTPPQLTLIDFNPPAFLNDGKLPSDRGEFCSPIAASLLKPGRSVNVVELGEAYERLQGRFAALRRPVLRVISYPAIPRSLPFPEVLQPQPTDPCSFAEFLREIEVQLRIRLFEARIPIELPFGGRSLADLLGWNQTGFHFVRE